MNTELYKQAERYATAYFSKAQDELIKDFGLQPQWGQSLLAHLMISFARQYQSLVELDRLHEENKVKIDMIKNSDCLGSLKQVGSGTPSDPFLVVRVPVSGKATLAPETPEEKEWMRQQHLAPANRLTVYGTMYQRPGESKVTANVGAWYETACYWRTRCERAESAKGTGK